MNSMRNIIWVHRMTMLSSKVYCETKSCVFHSAEKNTKPFFAWKGPDLALLYNRGFIDDGSLG